ncbi:hypothetical protein [Flavobacterium undicola]|uniref:hypothetical protein n=1 Tax=Flavobacterium undicola TaxID=1932779 RepID=UPI0015E1C850|nr:hypothetical protein [Flavobacterium undicola]MBA0883805.1 hypothetical protein [Flavobacterium undicola]
MTDYEQVEISEPYLIVGIFENGLFLSPLTNDLSDYDLKPIEKYLMVSTNVDFVINSVEYRTPNLPFLFGQIPPPIPNMFLNPLRIFSTRSRTSYGGTEEISIAVPITGTVKLYIDGFEEKDLGIIESMPDPVPTGFDYAVWTESHTYDVTDTALDVMDMSNISFTLTVRGVEYYLTHEGLSNLAYVDNSNTIGEITSVVKEYDSGFDADVIKIHTNFNSTVDARIVSTFNFNYKKPGQTTFTTAFVNYGSGNNTLFILEDIVDELFGVSDVYSVLPIDTEFFFSDSLGVFTESNHKKII